MSDAGLPGSRLWTITLLSHPVAAIYTYRQTQRQGGCKRDTAVITDNTGATSADRDNVLVVCVSAFGSRKSYSSILILTVTL